MATNKKSLAQELADLFNPAPTKEYDPDGLDLGDGVKIASDDEYGEPRAAPSKRAPEKAMLLRGGIELEDAAYRGRKTSRAAIFGDDDDAAAGDSDEDEDVDLDLDLDLGEGEDGDGDVSDGDEDSGRRGAAGRAGPSGRGGAAGQGPKGGHAAAKRGAAAAALANGGPMSSDGEEHDDMDGEGEEEEEDGAADGESPSESGSDLDLDLGTGSGDGEEVRMEDEEEEEDDEEEGAGGRGRGRAGAAEAPSKRVAARAPVGTGGGGGGELEALEAEYEALQEEDERQLEALRKKGERDREKGAAVRNQQVLYERALEQRILLQKCLQASNGLPRADTHAALVAVQPDVREGYAHLAAAARDTLGQLLELQHALMSRNSAIVLPPAGGAAGGDALSASGRGSAAGAATKRRRRSDADADDGDAADALWQRVSCHHEALAPFRDTSLDSWHRRTVLSSGSGALRNSGLRALNQSISSQVQALMRDPGKFIKRTRLVLSACPRVLCEPPRAGAMADAAAFDPLGIDAVHASAAGAAAAGQSRGDGAAAPASSVAADVLDEGRDPETYDDSEFYQQLLKEFLDKGLAEGAAAAPKASKKRKLVDRRASKGRKLRYHVQEKLVAFMAPVDFTPPTFASNLFSNLFGHAGK